MRTLTNTTDLDGFLGHYGPEWRPGLLSEHVDLFQQAGGQLASSPSGLLAGWALIPDPDRPGGLLRAV